MKIIRVASSDQLTGLFSNEFSEAITLPPQSKIALLNGMFAIDSKSIFIPADTTISFSPKDGAGGNAPPTVTATLPEGYYTQTSLLSTLTQAMNYALPQETMDDVCFAWNVVVKSKAVSLNFARSAAVAFNLPNLQRTLSESGGTYTAASLTGTVPAGQFPAFGYSNVTVLPYNNTIKLKPGDNNHQFIFGLLKEKPTASDTYLYDDLFMYGIRSDGTDLHYIVNGVDVATEEVSTVDPATLGTTIEFDRGAVEFDTFVYDQTIPIPFSIEGYHLAIGLRANGASVGTTAFNQNPFDANSIENSTITRVAFPLRHTLHVDDTLTLGTLSPTNVTVNMSKSMRAVLGFADDPSPMKAISSHFAAQNQLISSSTPTSLTVECPNLGGMIQSYDGISQKRRPIVAVIPAMEQTNGMLTYQPGYPPFIDLNNRFPIQLSKLEVRLLSSFDDTEVNLEHPGTSMTFALDHNIPQKPTD